MLDPDTIRRLNLLHRSPEFVIHEDSPSGAGELLVVETIPDRQGVFWVSGRTVFQDGVSLPAVFRIDTDGGGELLATYWLLRGNWFHQSAPEATAILGEIGTPIFPYDWHFNVPLARDIFRA